MSNIPTAYIAAVVFIEAAVMGCTDANEQQKASAAFTALKRLEAKTEVGVNYRDYMSELGEAHFAVKQYLESREAEKSPDRAQAIEKAIHWYRLGGEVWKLSMGEPFMSCPSSFSITKYYCERYAELLPPKKETFRSEEMIPKAWARATAETARAAH